MESPPIPPWLASFYICILLASGVVWLKIIRRVWRRQPILEYEPRQVVPWGPIVALPALALMLLVVASGTAPESAPVEEVAIDPHKVLRRLTESIVLQTFLAGLVIIIAVIYGATRVDLGLPRSWRAVARDLGIGATTCLAAAGPVYLVQGLLMYFIGQKDPSRHPMFRMLTGGDSNVAVFLLAVVAAVVVAPVCEEIIFRLMLQGWLEKREDKAQAASESEFAVEQPYADDAQDERTQMAIEENSDDEHSAPEQSQPDAQALSLARCESRRGVFGLPHGMFPVLASSALFAAAHAGYGPEPIPIFLLALIFGYVYQRTHRILPTIVAHALFNLISMVSMWQMVFNSAE
jgi:membrane protease YdiL (CAAX protease family)